MSKQLKISHIIPIYSNHEENARTDDFISAGKIVRFNREKYRNGIHWMEIYINDRKVYVKKDLSKMFLVKKAKLFDNSCTVLIFENKEGNNYTFEQAFTTHRFNDMNQEHIILKRFYDEATKEKQVVLFYDENKVLVLKKILAKGEEVIITGEKNNFLEILYGRRTGYIQGDALYSETKNWWIVIVGIIVSIGIMGLSLYAYIDNGRSVGGSILIIPIIIITAVIVFFIKLILAGINITFGSIRKRF
ncbi:hypothetical protein [uncultured Chryseobacterium sp.]|uniref:hypothetical protein n=1 Tax=uncultured Chryseobacterium sp. TaxID=259322 RepID=UPI0025E1B08D|nr:hypothetical protein [uncultured Chryseobacterium sp.]